MSTIVNRIKVGAEMRKGEEYVVETWLVKSDSPQTGSDILRLSEIPKYLQRKTFNSVLRKVDEIRPTMVEDAYHWSVDVSYSLAKPGDPTEDDGDSFLRLPPRLMISTQSVTSVPKFAYRAWVDNVKFPENIIPNSDTHKLGDPPSKSLINTAGKPLQTVPEVQVLLMQIVITKIMKAATVGDKISDLMALSGTMNEEAAQVAGFKIKPLCGLLNVEIGELRFSPEKLIPYFEVNFSIVVNPRTHCSELYNAGYTWKKAKEDMEATHTQYAGVDGVMMTPDEPVALDKDGLKIVRGAMEQGKFLKLRFQMSESTKWTICELPTRLSDFYQ